MAIPGVEAFMLPILELAGDGKEHSISEAREILAKRFKITEKDLRELLPSGPPRYNTRVAWAKTYLEHAGLLQATKRGHFIITERGSEVLQTKPPRVDIKFLDRYPEFCVFAKRPGKVAKKYVPLPELSQTPEELLEASYQRIRKELAEELLNKAKICSPPFFEKLVVELLLKMGYGGSRQDAGQAIGATGDGGIDGIIKEDRLGLDVVYIQAKRWEGTVSRPEIQKFVGALQGQRAKKGVFITTSAFSKEAVDYVSRIDVRIVLVDGEQLSRYMIDFGIGVSAVGSYEIKRMDSDYFEEE
jgi:restriction system protein